MIKSFEDSYERAKEYLERPQRLKKPQIDSSRAVEYIELHSDHEDKEQNRESVSAENDLGLESGPELVASLKIKEEKIELLEYAVKMLSDRLGTEIVDENDENETSLMERTRRYETNVNTLHYQLDEEFGKTIYFITNVNIILVFN